MKRPDPLPALMAMAAVSALTILAMACYSAKPLANAEINFGDPTAAEQTR